LLAEAFRWRLRPMSILPPVSSCRTAARKARLGCGASRRCCAGCQAIRFRRGQRRVSKVRAQSRRCLDRVAGGLVLRFPLVCSAIPRQLLR
jgi:hypothetical protein